MAPAAKLRAKLLCCHACTTASGQVHQGIGQAACTREADIAVKPQAVLVETRDRTKRVAASIVGETAVVSDFGKKTPNRWNRIPQFDGQRLDLPAWLFEKKGGKAFAWLCIEWHDGLLIKYCIQPNILANYAILYQKERGLPSPARAQVN